MAEIDEQMDTIRDALGWLDEQVGNDDDRLSPEDLATIRSNLESALLIMEGSLDIPPQSEVVTSERLPTSREEIPLPVQPELTPEMNTPKIRDPIPYPSTPVDYLAPEAEGIAAFLHKRGDPELRRAGAGLVAKPIRELFEQHGVNHRNIPWSAVEGRTEYYGVLRHENEVDKKGIYLYCSDSERDRCRLQTIWTQDTSFVFGRKSPYREEGPVSELKQTAAKRIKRWLGRSDYGKYALVKGSMSAYGNLPISGRSRTIINNNWRAAHASDALRDTVALF